MKRFSWPFASGLIKLLTHHTKLSSSHCVGIVSEMRKTQTSSCHARSWLSKLGKFCPSCLNTCATANPRVVSTNYFTRSQVIRRGPSWIWFLFLSTSYFLFVDGKGPSTVKRVSFTQVSRFTTMYVVKWWHALETCGMPLVSSGCHHFTTYTVVKRDTCVNDICFTVDGP